MSSKNSILYISFLYVLVPSTASARTRAAIRKQGMPQISVRWTNDAAEEYIAQARYFKPYIFSMFAPDFQDHLLPSNTIVSRDGKSEVQGSQLSLEIEQTIGELRKGERKLTHFTILKDKEFNWQKFAGLIVLKSKTHSFVVKLFTENPATILDVRSKGMQHATMSRLSGGANRYLAGFTRIKNLELTKKRIQGMDLPVALDFPRKWYWVPSSGPTMTLTGTKFKGPDDSKVYSMQLPSTYAIVADCINTDRSLAYMRNKYRVKILDLCQMLNFEIDPNLKNYHIERGTGKVVIIDTEHYRSLLALDDKKIPTNSYMMLHLYVAAHAMGRGLVSAKPQRRAL